MSQMHNAPTALHRQLKARAAKEGLSLSDYLLNEACRSLERPTLQEILARLETRASVVSSQSPAEVLRASRDQD